MGARIYTYTCHGLVMQPVKVKNFPHIARLWLIYHSRRHNHQEHRTKVLDYEKMM
jgi:hypothetical protein